MFIHKNFPIVECKCISIKERKNKRKGVKSEMKGQGLKFTEENFHIVERNKEDPKRGCLESHLNVIVEGLKKSVKYLWIMEDDILFIRKLKKVPKPPKQWDMLYLGGTVKHIFSRESQEEMIQKGKTGWIRMTCWTTHSYILNLQNRELINDILRAKQSNVEIDRYYIDNIHLKYKCYMIHPMICIQKAGYSDVEKKRVEYSFMEKSMYGLKKPRYEITQDGNYKLLLPEVNPNNFPKVSIVTVTRDREWIFSLPKFNFKRFYYPPEKLEWIIVDSSKTDDLKMSFQKDSRIKYIHVSEPCTIAHKRNIGAMYASGFIICHMDDDDYYPPESIMARVKSIICYQKVDCVGCSKIGIYDIRKNRSFISSDGHMSLSEASMAYKKSFWEEQQFDSECERGEYMMFMQGRLDRIVDLPYIFIITAINHGKNYTPRTEWLNNLDYQQELRNSQSNKVINFTDTWDEEGKEFIANLRKYILNLKV